VLPTLSPAHLSARTRGRRHAMLTASVGLAATLLTAAPAAAAPTAPAAVASADTRAAAPARASLVTSADRARVRRLAPQLRRLRACESGGNYRINTGNGYYGAYQFDMSTWRALGYRGRPNTAPAPVQDAAVARLHARRGWAPWPACSRMLGLR